MSAPPSEREARLKLFGQRLQQLRKREQLSQKDFAQRLGAESGQHIGRIEQGKGKPSLDLLLQLVEAFGVSLDEMLGLGRSTTNTVAGNPLMCAWDHSVVFFGVPDPTQLQTIVDTIKESTQVNDKATSRGFNAD